MTEERTAKVINDLISERDSLRARVAELEAERADLLGNHQRHVDAWTTLSAERDRLASRVAELEALYRDDAPAMEFHGEPCDYCRKPVNNLAGNPSEWCLAFPRPDGSGFTRPHHVGCVMQRLIERDRLRAALVPVIKHLRDEELDVWADGLEKLAGAGDETKDEP